MSKKKDHKKLSLFISLYSNFSVHGHLGPFVCEFQLYDLHNQEQYQIECHLNCFCAALTLFPLRNQYWLLGSSCLLLYGCVIHFLVRNDFPNLFKVIITFSLVSLKTLFVSHMLALLNVMENFLTLSHSLDILLLANVRSILVYWKTLMHNTHHPLPPNPFSGTMFLKQINLFPNPLHAFISGGIFHCFSTHFSIY